MHRLRTFLNIQPGEEVPALLLFLYLTLVLISFVITKSIRDSLFLFRFNAADLPYMYIGVAVASGFGVSVYVRLTSRVGQLSLISGTLAFFAATAILLWRVEHLQWPSVAWVFWIWSSIFGIITVTQVWTVANHVFNVRQAKRLFPLMSSGGILGSAIGGLISATAVKLIGTDNLVLFLIPLLFACVGIAQILARRYALSERPRREELHEVEAGKRVANLWKTMTSSRYLQLISLLIVLSLIVTLIIDNQFKFIVQQTFHSKDEFTRFFGSFTAYLSCFALLIQIFVGSRAMEKYGVRTMLLLLPVALLAGTAVLLVFPLALWAVVALKGGDHVLRYSVDKATVELLYLPVPLSVKAEVKSFIDMVLSRFADGLGGVLLLLMCHVLKLRLTGGVALFDIALISFWIWIAFRVRKEYVTSIRVNLSDRPELPRATLKMILSDAKSVASLRSMFDSNDEEVVLYAIELAVTMKRNDLIPPTLLTHSSPKVRLKAFDSVPLSEREILARARVDTNSSVRVLAITRAGAIAHPTKPISAISGYLQSKDLRLRLAALASLVQHSESEDTARIRDQLTSVVAELGETSPEWLDVAQALGEIRHPAAVDLHLRLLHHANPDIRRQAILSAGRAGHRELVPFLIEMLAESEFAGDARHALQKFGSRILGTLRDILMDPQADIESRRNIPLVLACNSDQGSVDLLIDSLFDYDGLLRYRAIRALGKLRVLDPSLNFDSTKITLRIREESENTLWLQKCAAILYPASTGQDMLNHLLKEKIARGKERAFRLLALLLPPTTACASFLALVEDDRLKLATAAEYLDNVLPGKLKLWVLPLIESKVEGSRQKESVASILEHLIKFPDPVLNNCVMDAIEKNPWAGVFGQNPLLHGREEK
jgi:AAA family ATP:ADP antiporter